MFEEMAARKEIAERNKLRRESGLPLVSVEDELESMEAVYEEEQFERFCDTPGLREKVEAELLAEIRGRSGNPDWKPSGMLSGGGWWFGVQVEKRLQKMYETLPRKESNERVEF